MSVTAGYKVFLASGMLVFGSINTLTTKTADMVNTTGRPDFPPHMFSHPYLQGVGMFLGEFSCLIIFYMMTIYRNIKARNNPDSPLPPVHSCNPFLFILPAICDMCATTTVYFGLNFTYASSFQMLRGSVIIFTTLLSILFLKKRVRMYQWVGVVFVILGLGVVGLADMFFSKSTTYSFGDIIMGDTLIILAQLITACQMVVEEKFVSGNVHPLQAVGWEGFWGALMLGSLLYPLSHFNVGARFSPNLPYHTLEDVIDGLYQMSNNHTIIYATLGNMISIACFNFFGISVTKNMAATTRMVLDSMRTIVIWAFSIGLGWQSFVPLQLVGFNSLLVGMAWYNKILLPKFLKPDDYEPVPTESGDDAVQDENAIDADDENDNGGSQLSGDDEPLLNS